MKSPLVFACFVLGLASVGGCSAADVDAVDQDDTSDEQALRANVTPGSFKLYSQANPKPSPSCDVHTDLELARGTFSTAKLQEDVDGTCKLAVIPNPRSYRLRAEGGSCGSKNYAGSFVRDGHRWTIEITDHRSRLCLDLVPGLVVVKETTWNGNKSTTTTKYGIADTITASGTMKSVAAIGGESTGRALLTKDRGMLEMELDKTESSLFTDGAPARATGTLRVVRGVEIKERTILDVSELVVCPKTKYVNCMPPTTSTYCRADNTAWVKDNCPNVKFVY